MPAEKPRVRRVPVAMPTATAEMPWFRNIRFSGFSALMLGIVVLFVVVLAPSLRTLVSQQEQIAQKERAVAAAKHDVADKTKDVARWNDPAYIETQARDRLLYVYPGEESYLVMGTTNGSSAAASTGSTSSTRPPVSTTVQTPKVDWVSSMFRSVLESGLTDKDASQLGK